VRADDDAIKRRFANAVCSVTNDVGDGRAARAAGLLTLAEELHFARSAERLGVTPSRVSQSLRGLEAKLGGQLVHRTNRTVRLTALGERFRDEIGAAHEQLAGVLQRTEAASRDLRRTLRVGLFSGVAAGPHFFRIVRAFEARVPECEVETEDSFPELFGALGRGDIDLLATWLPHGQTDVVVGPTLAREPRVLAVGPEHPLAGRSEVSLEDLADYETVAIEGVPRALHDAWIPARTHSGRRIRRRHLKRVSMNELAYLVAAGKIVHPTMASTAQIWGHPELVYVPITDLPPLRSALVWRRGLTDATAREFIRVAREVLRATP
jgi:DNA-binding transcriptional LysR family regulator